MRGVEILRTRKWRPQGTHMTLPGKAGAASGTTGLEPRFREGTAGSSHQRRRRSFRSTALCGHLVVGLTSQIRADVFVDGSEGHYNDVPELSERLNLVLCLLHELARRIYCLRKIFNWKIILLRAIHSLMMFR